MGGIRRAENAVTNHIGSVLRDGIAADLRYGQTVYDRRDDHVDVFARRTGISSDRHLAARLFVIEKFRAAADLYFLPERIQRQIVRPAERCAEIRLPCARGIVVPAEEQIPLPNGFGQRCAHVGESRIRIRLLHCAAARDVFDTVLHACLQPVRRQRHVFYVERSDLCYFVAVFVEPAQKRIPFARTQRKFERLPVFQYIGIDCFCPVGRNKRAAARIERDLKLQRLIARVQPCDLRNIALVENGDLFTALLCVEPADKFIPRPVNRMQHYGFAVGNIIRVDLSVFEHAVVFVADEVFFRRIHRIERLIALHARKRLVKFAAAVGAFVPAEEIMPCQAAIGQRYRLPEADRKRMLRSVRAVRRKRTAARV